MNYNKIVTYKDRSGKSGKPNRVHYLDPTDHSHTLCGINLHAPNAPWHAKAPTVDSLDVPRCQRCLNSAASRKKKFNAYQAKRSKQRHKNF